MDQFTAIFFNQINSRMTADPDSPTTSEEVKKKEKTERNRSERIMQYLH